MKQGDPPAARLTSAITVTSLSFFREPYDRPVVRPHRKGRPSPRELPYAAAKAGLNTLTQGFARAFGPTVRVNSI